MSGDDDFWKIATFIFVVLMIIAVLGLVSVGAMLICR